jgi:hypothetical protein
MDWYPNIPEPPLDPPDDIERDEPDPDRWGDEMREQEVEGDE